MQLEAIFMRKCRGATCCSTRRRRPAAFRLAVARLAPVRLATCGRPPSCNSFVTAIAILGTSRASRWPKRCKPRTVLNSDLHFNASRGTLHPKTNCRSSSVWLPPPAAYRNSIKIGLLRHDSWSSSPFFIVTR